MIVPSFSRFLTSLFAWPYNSPSLMKGKYAYFGASFIEEIVATGAGLVRGADGVGSCARACTMDKNEGDKNTKKREEDEGVVC